MSLAWLCREFGLSSIHAVGRNAYLIILARALRMFAFGTTFVLAIFLNALSFSDAQIGAFFTLTLLGDVFLGTGITLVADRLGRRRVLFFGSGLMVLSGVVFACFESFWILLPAAIVGVISATGGDFGPFRSIEESMLSHITSPETRADVLAWHVTLSLLMQAVGSETAGRIITHLDKDKGWALKDAYHALFWIYAVMGVANAGLVSLLTDECEVVQAQSKDGQGYSQLPQEEEGRARRRRSSSSGNSSTTAATINSIESAATRETTTPPRNILRKLRLPSWLLDSLSRISAPTRATMYKLWILLALDSISDGMVPPSMTHYYLDSKFHPSKSTLGDAQSAASVLGGIGTVFAGPLARKIGLINTMVFTHAPSSAAVLLFAAPSSLWLTLVLLFVRQGLNSMDQAPRTAFIAAVSRSEERTAIMGITQTVRTLAATLGPSITGMLAGSERFGVAFVVAGSCRLAYDAGLYLMFVNMPVHQREEAAVVGGVVVGGTVAAEEDVGLVGTGGGGEGEEREGEGDDDIPTLSGRSSRLMVSAGDGVRRSQTEASIARTKI